MKYSHINRDVPHYIIERKITMKRITSMLLSLILIFSFTACSDNSSEKKYASSAAGGESTGYSNAAASGTADEPFYYDEKDISSSSGLKHPGVGCINSKNQLVVADGTDNATTRFAVLERDGRQAGEIKCSLPGLCKAMAMDAQDNIYAVMSERAKDNEYKQVLNVISAKGEIISNTDMEKLYGKGGGGLYATDIAAGADGNIYLTDPMKPVQVLDRSGKLLKTAGSGKYVCVCFDDANNLYLLDISSKKYYLEKVEAASGKSIWKKDITADLPVSYSSIDGIKIKYCKGDKGIYLTYGRGILTYSTDGKFKGSVLDYGDYTILASGLPVCDLNTDSSRNIYLMAVSDTSFKLFQYTRQKGIRKKAGQNKTITVSVPRPDVFMDTAASKFQIANPGYKVVVKAAAEDEKSYENYKTVLNTEIMAGKGPDIFSINGLPYEKFIYRNSFADLSELMEKDKSFDSGKFYTNILDALKYKGRLYMFPVSFSFNSLIANESLLESKSIVIDDSKWTWKDFDSILQKFTENSGNKKTAKYSALPDIASSQLLDLVMNGSYGRFIDLENRKSSFTDPEFTQMLNIVRTYGGKAAGKVSYKRYFESITRGTLAFDLHYIYDYMGYAMVKGMSGNAKLSMLRFPEDSNTRKGAFSSNSIYAINAKSANKDGAFEFLKYLVSDEMQTDGNMTGFAINKHAQKKRAAAVNDYINSGKAGTIGVGGPDGSITYQARPLTAGEIDIIDRYIDSLGFYSNDDSEIMKIIEDESKAFLSGMKTAEDTSSFIQQRVDTYLGE